MTTNKSPLQPLTYNELIELSTAKSTKTLATLVAIVKNESTNVTHVSVGVVVTQCVVGMTPTDTLITVRIAGNEYYLKATKYNKTDCLENLDVNNNLFLTICHPSK